MRALPVRSRSVRGRSWSLAGTALLGVALLGLAGCSSTEPGAASTDGGSGTVAAPPPPPPAACLLDLDVLAGTTGLTWTPDATTASDTRCVYDPGAATTTDPTAASNGAGTGTGTGLDRSSAPAPGASSGEFLAVDITPADDRPVGAQLDLMAEVCDEGSRAAVGTGFVCRFDGESVYAGLVRGEDVITVAASAVPAGTTAAALTMAIGQQVDALS